MTTEYLLNREIEHVLAALMPQNRLIMRMILRNGMRVSDVLELKTSDLRLSGWYVEKKTGKRRRYGIDKVLLSEIQEQAGPFWAFPGIKPGTHKTRQAVWHDVKRAAKAFRLDQNIGTHSFRKVYAVELMRKYGSIEKVQRNLNHCNPSVTAIYCMSDILLERRQKQRRSRTTARAGASTERAERDRKGSARESEGQAQGPGHAGRTTEAPGRDQEGEAPRSTTKN